MISNVSPMVRGGAQLITVMVVSALLAACGEDPPVSGTGAADAAEAANSYFAALVERDGERACAFLTEEGQRIAVKVFEGQGDPNYPDIESLDPADCADAIAGAPKIADIPEIKPGDVDVAADGQTAMVIYPDGNGVGFVASDGGWLLANPIPSGR